MPTNNVKNRTFEEIFKGPVRFEVPFFQRGYAWEKKQWDQLFVDIDEQLLAELESGTDLEDAEHFFGPIVVLERTGTPELKEFVVIDGQQRITTAYLLLALISEQLKTKKHLSEEVPSHMKHLAHFLVNDVGGNDDYLRLKVFSCKGDRLPTYRVVFGTDANPVTTYLQTDLQMYVPDTNQIDAFRKYALKKLSSKFSDVPSLWNLAQVVLKCLKMVWIPLDESKDDPQAIFESLNDKGMPLSASELLCNYLFQPIIKAKEPYEELHNQQWLGPKRKLKDDDIFESYLRNLFSIGEPKMVGKHRKLYIHFKNKNRKLTASAAKEHLGSIGAGAPLYLSITEPESFPYANDAIAQVLVKIASTGMESSTPFVLAVLRAHARNILSSEVAVRMLNEALVLLVRRKVAELPTTQYDAMFPSLLGKIIPENEPIVVMQDQFKKQQVWVSDQDFKTALVTKATYRERERPFSRMLLVEIDRRLQIHGQLPDYTTVRTIEHVLPQTLNEAWKAYLGTDAQDEHLPSLTHTLGNLCLLSGPANSSAGQDPFETKRAAYSPVTALARQIKDFKGPWSLHAIRDRSALLAETALAVWKWAGT